MRPTMTLTAQSSEPVLGLHNYPTKYHGCGDLADILGIPVPDWKDDGHTYFHIDLSRSLGVPSRTFAFRLAVSQVGGITVDWGDGTSDTNTETDYYGMSVIFSHTYAANAGDRFAVRIISNQGNFRFSYSNSCFLPVLSWPCYGIELGVDTQGRNASSYGSGEFSGIKCRLFVGSGLTWKGNGGNAIKSITLGDDVTISTDAKFRYSTMPTLPISNNHSFTDMNAAFNGSDIEKIDTSAWDVSGCTNMSMAFSSCNRLYSIDVSSWDVSACTNMNQTFRYCNNLQALDISGWDVSACTDMTFTFGSCTMLVTLIGGAAEGAKTPDPSKGPRVDFDISNDNNLDRASLLWLIGWVADLNSLGLPGKTLTLGNTNKAKLTAEEQAIATAKGWTIQ